MGTFLDGYIASRTDVKPRTTTNLKRAEKALVDFFGADKPLDQVTAGDADEFRSRLLTSLGENTVRRICGRAKQFYRAAVRKRLLKQNPFGDMKGCAVRANRSRDFHVPIDIAERVLAACPDNEWRLLFALSRFGGLRCPSEHLSLKWEDIDWEHGRMTIRSPKTEHHEGREFRIIPIFPELRPYLEAVQVEATSSGTDYVIVSQSRRFNANLRTQFKRILERAKITPWPKLFQNLRASRATELAAKFPAHIAAEWLGHSTLIAQKHYWQISDDNYQRATTAPSALHIPVQQPPRQEPIHRNESQIEKADRE